MDNLLQYIFAVVVTNAGGEGKTMLSLLLRALWSLAREPNGLLDADAGNYSASVQQIGTASAETTKTLGWSIQSSKASAIVADHAYQHVVMDTGANMMASHREIVDLLPELQRQFASRGYRTIAFMPVSTNKEGAVGAVNDLESKLAGFEKVFVRVNRDGSGHYEEGLDSSRSIDLGHLSPGFQNYVRKVARGYLPAVTTPPAGYKLAADHVADWMKRFLTQPLVAEILGPRPLLALGALKRQPPTRFRFGVMTLAQVTDAALEQNAYRSKAMDVLDRGKWTADIFREVATLMESGNL